MFSAFLRLQLLLQNNRTGYFREIGGIDNQSKRFNFIAAGCFLCAAAGAAVVEVEVEVEVLVMILGNRNQRSIGRSVEGRTELEQRGGENPSAVRSLFCSVSKINGRIFS